MVAALLVLEPLFHSMYVSPPTARSVLCFAANRTLASNVASHFAPRNAEHLSSSGVDEAILARSMPFAWSTLTNYCHLSGLWGCIAVWCPLKRTACFPWLGMHRMPTQLLRTMPIRPPLQMGALTLQHVRQVRLAVAPHLRTVFVPQRVLEAE